MWCRRCTDHCRSSMPECPPYVKQLQVTQPPLKPHFWKLDLDLTVPKNPRGANSPSPSYNCQRHCLVQQKREKNGKENTNPEAKPWLERGTPRTELPFYCHYLLNLLLALQSISVTDAAPSFRLHDKHTTRAVGHVLLGVAVGTDSSCTVPGLGMCNPHP